MSKTRKELKSEYKSAGTPAGVFRIRNLATGRVLVGAAENIPGILNSNRFQLQCGSHPNRSLQADWKEFGPDSFAFEPLDLLEPGEPGAADVKAELALLEKLWLEKLEPYGERGYNQRPK